MNSVWLLAILVVGLAASGGVRAQEKPAAAPPAVKDERALKLLKGMSDTLAGARTLSFRARSQVPMASPSGQWLTLFATSRVVLQRPDKLFVETRGDVFHKDLYYDGTTWTTVAPGEKLYAQRAVRSRTLDAIIGGGDEQADEMLPFADVLVSDAYADLTRDLSSALYVGQSTMAGVKVDHLALTAKALDWELWIGTRDRLPRLMSGAYRDLPRHAAFMVEFTDWKLNPAVTARTFIPAIPAGARKIEFKRETAPPGSR